jgi:hypothetical protein
VGLASIVHLLKKICANGVIRESSLYSDPLKKMEVCKECKNEFPNTSFKSCPVCYAESLKRPKVNVGEYIRKHREREKEICDQITQLKEERNKMRRELMNVIPYIYRLTEHWESGSGFGGEEKFAGYSLQRYVNKNPYTSITSTAEESTVHTFEQLGLFDLTKDFNYEEGAIYWK